MKYRSVNFCLLIFSVITPILGNTLIDHLLDFHLDHSLYPEYDKYSGDPDWEDKLWNDMKQKERDRDSSRSSDRDNGGRDFTPDRDK